MTADTPFSKAEYESIRAGLAFTPSPAINALTLAFNAGLLALAVHLLSRGDAVSYWIAQILLPVVFFQAFSLLHECGHGSFASSRIANTLIGSYASVLCFMPFFPWKYVHSEHHVWTGNADRDPGLALVRRARNTGQLPSILDVSWRTWVPLGAFVQHLVFWSYPITALRRGSLPLPRLLRCAGSVAFLVVAYVALHALAPDLLRPINFAPAIVLYLMLEELVNIPHHVGLTSFDARLPLWQQHMPTRSCNYPPVISELLVLNFNFHIEHHLFPQLPWYRLRRARQLVKPALGEAYRETQGIDWHVKERARHFVQVLIGAE